MSTNALVGANRWSAWVSVPKVGGITSRIYLGSHLTQRLAARCEDRALLFLEADPNMTLPLQLTFKREDYREDEQLRTSLRRDQFFDLLLEESSHSSIDYQSWPSTTACLRKFFVQEKALGNLSTQALELTLGDGTFYDIDLST